MTPRGAELLREAFEARKGLSLRKLSEILKRRGVRVGFTGLHYVISGKQDSIVGLPVLCDELGVEFYRTQPLHEAQARLLDALEKVKSRGPAAVVAAVTVFETYVRGVVGSGEDGAEKGNGSADGEEQPARSR